MNEDDSMRRVTTAAATLAVMAAIGGYAIPSRPSFGNRGTPKGIPRVERERRKAAKKRAEASRKRNRA